MVWFVVVLETNNIKVSNNNAYHFIINLLATQDSSFWTHQTLIRNQVAWQIASRWPVNRNELTYRNYYRYISIIYHLNKILQYGNFFCLPDELPTAQMLFHILRFHYVAVNSPNFYHKARWVFLVPNLLTSWRTRKRFWAAIEWCNIWYNSDLAIIILKYCNE